MIPNPWTEFSYTTPILLIGFMWLYFDRVENTHT